MTYTQKETLKMALAVYAEHCNQMMSLLKNKETQEYYKKELDYIWDAIAAVDALEEDP
ncbi:MAG TPA: hypothetical protein H9846_01960 [Candidatus Gemmiger excrementipullorum]|uniref:Uncharacterized protein n=1 Tax=Candidatus Gemmiger excrementipullorum TaxID=2838610 RepID=A0A9D1XZ20_9FIRM|nr:hypothetical protein [Candidatus Gemmiger excrementipullorum]